MTGLRVLGLVPYPLGRVPGQRYRVEQWSPRAASLGLEVELSPFFSARALDLLYRPGRFLPKALATLAGHRKRIIEGLRRRHFDVVYVYRECCPLAPMWLERLMTGRTPILYDFDDAIYLPASSEANRWVKPLRSPRKVAAACRQAVRVTVGNETLAAQARQWNPSVQVVPSTIETTEYVIRPRPANPRPVLGWTGSHTTVQYLRTLLPALQRLSQSWAVDLKVIGAHLEPVAGLNIQCLPWTAATEVEDLRSIDIGLMPLDDDDWSRAKCGMKALQYMALGIPPVVSPVGVNAEIVMEGRNGLHARTEEQWVRQLSSLLADSQMRARLGKEARRTVEARYSAAVWAPEFARILCEAAATA